MSGTLYRGVIVNALSVGILLAAMSQGDLSKMSEFPLWISLLVLVSLLAEPFLTWMKMSAVLVRSPNWGTHRLRPLLVNLFTVLLFWGARFALFAAMVVTALTSLFPREELNSFLLPIIIFVAIREGIIVAAYCRAEPKKAPSPVQEWGIDLGLACVIGIAEALAFGLFGAVRDSRIEFPEAFYLIFFQLLFFVMFFLPIRMPYTIEEVAKRWGSWGERTGLTLSFLLCFFCLFYAPIWFK